MVQQISQQHQPVGLLPPEGVQQQAAAESRAVEVGCNEQLHKVFSFVVRFYLHDCSARPGKKQLKILQPPYGRYIIRLPINLKICGGLRLFRQADDAVMESVK